MSRTKLSSGVSNVAIALLVIPLVLGGIAYTAMNPLALGSTAVDTPQSTALPTPLTSYGVQDRQMIREHCENVSTVSIEGTIVNVSIGTGGRATVTVDEGNGEISTVLVGGRWLGPNNTLLTPPELANKLSVGEHVTVKAFIACDGDVRATEINIGGITYTLLQGPLAHGPHGHGGWNAHIQGHHGQCGCGECHNGS